MLTSAQRTDKIQICDLFRHHERGLYMGIYIVCTNNGPHLAPIVGGYISQNLGWRWCFWIPAIYQGCLWILLIFTLPETLYSNKEGNKLQGLTYSQKLVFHSKVLDRPIRLRDFGTTFRMIKYAAVILPTIYCATANTYGSLLFGITGSEIGTTIYKFKTSQTGLFQGIPLTIGCFIGEMCAGWVSDIFANTYARRHNGHWKAESRLLLMPLCTTLCIGTAVYGFCIQNRKPWIDSAISMAVSGFGLQVATTMVYTYCTDSYEAQSGEIGSVIYCFKAGMWFTPPRLDSSLLTNINCSYCLYCHILCSSIL
jgi:MFS family permease